MCVHLFVLFSFVVIFHVCPVYSNLFFKDLFWFFVLFVFVFVVRIRRESCNVGVFSRVYCTGMFVRSYSHCRVAHRMKHKVIARCLQFFLFRSP